MPFRTEICTTFNHNVIGLLKHYANIGQKKVGIVYLNLLYVSVNFPQVTFKKF